MFQNSLKKGPYREITWEALVLGFFVGILLNASITYAGLLIGFTIVGSEIAAIIGWGVLRGILRRSTIVENNINQTVASAINNSGAGIIFTIPVLYLRGADFEFLHVILATMCGATLGVAFIIPVRKQMIDIDRLRFPSGTAVGAILKSPGAGVRKAILLAAGMGFSALVSIAVHTGFIAETIDLGALLGMPAYFRNVWAVSLLSLGAGFISGRAGLAVLIGGILAYWIITPLAVNFGWVPAELSDFSLDQGGFRLPSPQRHELWHPAARGTFYQIPVHCRNRLGSSPLHGRVYRRTASRTGADYPDRADRYCLALAGRDYRGPVHRHDRLVTG